MSDGPTGLVPVVDISGDPERVGRGIDRATRRSPPAAI
jgi:hypothetical protein